VDPGQARITTQHFAFQAGSHYGHIAQAVQGLPCTGVVGNVHSLQRNSENHALFFRHYCSSLALPAWHALCLCHKLAQDVLASYRSTCLWRDASMGTALHILHLEDNPDDQELVRLTLVKEGMSCVVPCARLRKGRNASWRTRIEPDWKSSFARLTKWRRSDGLPAASRMTSTTC